MALITESERATVEAGIKTGWEAMRVLQGSPTIDILRYTVTGDSDELVQEGERALVPGLSSIDAAVFPKPRKRKVIRGLIEYVDADMVFVIYGVDVLMSDRIQYNGNKYQVLRQPCYNASSGRCVIGASKV